MGNLQAAGTEQEEGSHDHVSRQDAVTCRVGRRVGTQLQDRPYASFAWLDGEPSVRRWQMSFVPVPASAIRERLAGAGFTLVPSSHGEEVYERPHDKDARYTVLVYSSIQRGAGEARECGEDAIRVVALFLDGRYSFPARKVPIFKSARV